MVYSMAGCLVEMKVVMKALSLVDEKADLTADWMAEPLVDMLVFQWVD
jgi:hypothetical protein